ncbi:hypothetical protein AO370_0759 [Moraxella catarrhalis]|uniref:Uncharacterized protein n=1 Tax=Moraxella catarrhalis TaxID=480 RepID=A0AB36DPZ1_MORCA|nr:hypothetical protein AO378_0481 [Moraxella catarrhalis]OAV26345.1 hypothetical protein AO370_0759 [Moraxella catarrhalis]OAV36555.1 hypothetical protein AO365_0950 [Moraxella catarrhalis]
MNFHIKQTRLSLDDGQLRLGMTCIGTYIKVQIKLSLASQYRYLIVNMMTKKYKLAMHSSNLPKPSKIVWGLVTCNLVI